MFHHQHGDCAVHIPFTGGYHGRAVVHIAHAQAGCRPLAEQIKACDGCSLCQGKYDG